MDSIGDDDPPCIINALCEYYDGLAVEAKGIKEHYFKPYISKLYDRKVHLSWLYGVFFLGFVKNVA